ncbi:unnamed protein product [Camellia sinensis]
MGKNQDTAISIPNNHPGCMWGILHVLHHHRWQQVKKKMLLHKRLGGPRHAIGNNINATNAGEMQKNADAETNNSLIQEKATEATPVTKSSVKSRIKALISEEMSKRKGRHRRSSSYPTRLLLTRTNSIHHLVAASDSNPLAEGASKDASPVIVHQDNENSSLPSTLKAIEEPITSDKKCELCAAMLTMNYMGHGWDGEHGKQPVDNDTLLQDMLNKAKQDLLTYKLTNAKESNVDVSFHESKQFLDVFDLFHMNKELFLKVLQDPNSPLAHYFHGQLAFKSKIGFTKSKSFPLPGSSGRSGSRPIKLKHEQETEVGSQVQQLAELESTKDAGESSMPILSESKIDGVPKPNVASPELLDSSSTGSSTSGLKSRQDNRMVMKRFMNLKQKIKRAIKESRKERHRITMDAVLHKIPYGRKVSKDVRDDIPDFMGKCNCERNGKGRPQDMRRTSSFNESMDRYRQLYEASFNTEAKHHISERLKLRTEETPSPSGSPKTLGRILSLPNLRSYYYLQHEDSPDVNSNVNTVGSRFDQWKTSNLPAVSENETLLDASVEIDSENNSVDGELNHVAKDDVGSRSFMNEEANGEVGFTSDDLGSLETTENDAQHENGIQDTIRPVNKREEPCPDSVEDSSPEDMASPTTLSLSEEADSASKPRSLFSDELESLDYLANQIQEAGMDSPVAVKSILVNLNTTQSSIDQLNNEFLRVLVNTKDTAKFNYVKYVLELSGFTRDELLGMWHSPDQPMDPSMFEEVEGWLLAEPDCPENEEIGNSNHLLLFDLVNEVLLEIYERSFTYCPKLLSLTSHIRPVPMGHQVLEVVWMNISGYLSWKPEADPSLDDTISRDLAKGDRWMNLQFEAECVGLELEDMIFDDLLDELVWT